MNRLCHLAVRSTRNEGYQYLNFSYLDLHLLQRESENRLRRRLEPCPGAEESKYRPDSTECLNTFLSPTHARSKNPKRSPARNEIS